MTAGLRAAAARGGVATSSSANVPDRQWIKIIETRNKGDQQVTHTQNSQGETFLKPSVDAHMLTI
jgi:hypothetical protein